jgi:hypothetical protein
VLNDEVVAREYLCNIAYLRVDYKMDPSMIHSSLYYQSVEHELFHKSIKDKSAVSYERIEGEIKLPKVEAVYGQICMATPAVYTNGKNASSS